MLSQVDLNGRGQPELVLEALLDGCPVALNRQALVTGYMTLHLCVFQGSQCRDNQEALSLVPGCRNIRQRLGNEHALRPLPAWKGIQNPLR